MCDLTCIHQSSGLCSECQEAYLVDPQAYMDYGDHPVGIARWNAFREEMDAWERARREEYPE